MDKKVSYPLYYNAEDYDSKKEDVSCFLFKKYLESNCSTFQAKNDKKYVCDSVMNLMNKICYLKK